ncbi:MAG: ribosomal protein S18-alanine N-acetyltransferase [Anaerolineales bacterium]
MKVNVVESTATPVPGSQADIVPATWHDFGAVQRIEHECFPQDAWPVWDILAVLTLPAVVRLKAVIGDKVVGFIAGDIRQQENLAWIATIGVLPDYRRRGIGAALLTACEAQLPVAKIRLCVRVSNTGALALYRQYGYHRVDLWPAYYKGGEDALVMEKQPYR